MPLYLYNIYNSGKITCGTLPLLIRNEKIKGNNYQRYLRQKESKIGIYYLKNENISAFKNKYIINSILPMVLTGLIADSCTYLDIKTDKQQLFWAIPDKSLDNWNSFKLSQVLSMPTKNFEQFETFIYLSINTFKKVLRINTIDVVKSPDDDWYTICDKRYYFNCKKNPDKSKDLSYIVPDGNLAKAILVNTAFDSNPFTVISKL